MKSTQPHIVKFSGGRSSGMMLMNMLNNNTLDPKRGDCIVFNNTSAEHEETYIFTSKIKQIAEKQFNIPFFWIEYQTYEDAGKNYCYKRNPTYKLVNDKPFGKNNPNGYKYKGEVFEELLSFTNSVPSRVSRTCTLSMKIFITNSFLSDWFAQKDGIDRLGHFDNHSKISDDDIIKTHQRSGGTTPDKVLLKKKKFVRECLHIRPQQKYQDYTQAKIQINNKTLKKSIIGNKAQLYGDLAIDYVSCLGIRSDERKRLSKINHRIEQSQNDTSKSLFKQPQGEQIYAPLVDNNTTQSDVIAFWKKQAFNLNLPDNGLFSNCVYCPLKGTAKLQQIAKLEQQNKNKTNSPQSIDWWIDIEKKYTRDLVLENRKILSNDKVKYIGFFGSSDKLIYNIIKDKANNKQTIDKDLLTVNEMPCNCTD